MTKRKNKKAKNKLRYSKPTKNTLSNKKTNNNTSKTRKVLLIIYLIICPLTLATALSNIHEKNSMLLIFLLYYTTTNFFYDSIRKYTQTLIAFAWLNVVFFLLYGYYMNVSNIAMNIILMLLILTIITRNSIAFFQSITMSHIKTNFTIALSNIFQLIIGYGIAYKVIYYNVANSFKVTENLTELELYIDMIYFSFATFTTLGYGDIVPTHIITKILVITEVALFVALISISISFIKNASSKQPKISTR